MLSRRYGWEDRRCNVGQTREVTTLCICWQLVGSTADGFIAEHRGKGLHAFPHPLSPLAASFLRCASDRFLLTEPNTRCTIELPVATLRVVFGIIRNAVRNHPGFGVRLCVDHTRVL
jgi:hypothetical protein